MAVVTVYEFGADTPHLAGRPASLDMAEIGEEVYETG
jgi:hypothetical protein